jgi:hypothetical protein
MHPVCQAGKLLGIYVQLRAMVASKYGRQALPINGVMGRGQCSAIGRERERKRRKFTAMGRALHCSSIYGHLFIGAAAAAVVVMALLKW